MSKVCNNCNAPISWDIKRREELGIKGPLNPDKLTAHRCYPKVTIATERTTTENKDIKLTQVEALNRIAVCLENRPNVDPLIRGIAELTNAINAFISAMFASSEDERQEVKNRIEKRKPLIVGAVG